METVLGVIAIMLAQAVLRLVEQRVTRELPESKRR
ncbi:hypothetical protein JOF56_010901 [Kibdelosporangium banguiense]|uniref:ABC transporter permease n=1 Tax=Kibdelosporangium banguiense TaxID=1365924 RepID=A0ABS4U1I9_9PSEU|nr:hypothetical protein [Kibdelosporangium banguiense]